MPPIQSLWKEIGLSYGVKLGVILVIAFILNRILRSVTHRMAPESEADGTNRLAKQREQHKRRLASALYVAGTAAIVAGAVFTALLDFNPTAIAAAAGLVTVALGFGAQNLVRDMLNGFFTIFEDQYIVGETVKITNAIGSATTGRVENLTLRRTLLRDTEGALVTIPNGTIAQVANLSREWRQLTVDVAIPADGSVDAALGALERTATELRGDAVWSPILLDGPRVLGVESLGADGAILRLQLRTIPGRQDDAARELRRRIQARFEQERIPWGCVQRVELSGSETRDRVGMPQGS